MRRNATLGMLPENITKTELLITTYLLNTTKEKPSGTAASLTTMAVIPELDLSVTYTITSGTYQILKSQAEIRRLLRPAGWIPSLQTIEEEELEIINDEVTKELEQMAVDGQI